MSDTRDYMTDTGTSSGQAEWFGHPRGLSTLFFTEMWERFSYYGMRALLILFMTAATVGDNPGMGLDVGTAAAIYGLYTFFVYLLALPGGWVADNIWGQRKAVFVGGCIIAAGHFSMAFPSQTTFFLGLFLIVVGTGLLKPNVSTVVGELYPEGGARRDAGFSIFYMGINIGALAAPLIVGTLGEQVQWHYGFSLAGIGMVLGLIQYRLGERHLGDAGRLKTELSHDQLSALKTRFYSITVGVLAAVIAFGWAVSEGIIPVTLQEIASVLGVAIVLIVAVYFGYMMLFGGHTTEENKRLGVIFWLFILAALFWSGFEQAGSSLNLFAMEMTDRNVFGVELAAAALQAINPTLIVIFAPVFGWLWVWLARRNANPSIPVKFALGFVGLAAGFFVLAWGSANASATNQVTIAWLVVTYFFHTCGELALSPVGLSSITKLAPAGRVGQMMGIWFVGAALGNLFAGLVAGQLETMAHSDLFQTVAMITGGTGIVALLVSPGVKKLIGEGIE